MKNTQKSFYDAIGVDGLKKIALDYSVSNNIPDEYYLFSIGKGRILVQLKK